jgi:hypothetical protein
MRLMHCPFCGETERIRLRVGQALSSNVIHQCSVLCDYCFTNGPNGESINLAVARQAAVDGWNNRLTHTEDLVLRTTFKLIEEKPDASDFN